MNKLVYVILTCIFTSIFLSSCVKEDGAGVPRAKSLFLEHSEYNVDLENDTVDALTLRWIDVMNAKYRAYLSNAYTSDVEAMCGQPVAGELNTLSFKVAGGWVYVFVEKANLLSGNYGSTDAIDIFINLTGIPIDASQPSALLPTGSTIKATIHFKK